MIGQTYEEIKTIVSTILENSAYNESSLLLL